MVMNVSKELSVDWDRMRKTVLTLINAKYGRMADYQRNLPYLVYQDEETLETIQVSPNDAIIEVTNMSEIGKKIIVAEMAKINRVNQ